jgi:hypothetical protein
MRLKASWLGAPPRSGTNWRSKSSRASANIAISVQCTAPQSIAAKATHKTSVKS